VAFGQSAGPPASHRQLQELLELLQDAGYADFRDARGPMGLTQRQAAGKFTRDEAQAFIDRLLDSVHGDGPPPAPVAHPARQSAAERALRDLPAEALAAELQRRGWIVMEP